MIDPFGFAQGRLSIARAKALRGRTRCPQLAVNQTIRRLEFNFFSGTSLRHFRRKVIGRILSRKTQVYDRGGPGPFGQGEGDAIDYPD